MKQRFFYSPPPPFFLRVCVALPNDQTMTNSGGRPLESLTESQTAGPGGPITLQVSPP